MRILQVTAYYPPHPGGLESHVEALSRKLVAAGHEVVVYTSNVPRGRRHETVHGVEVHRFSSLLAPLGNPVTPGLLLKLLGRDRFDVIHAHIHYHLSSTLTALANIFARRRIVLTSHGTILGYSGWKRAFEVIFDKTIGRWTLNSADRVIALTDTQADRLVELGVDRRRIAVIPMWVELPEAGPCGDSAAFRRRYGLGDRMIVLFVGRLLPVKGLDILIEAAKHCSTRPAVVVIGDEAPGYGGTLSSLQNHVSRLGMEQDIFFLGWFPKEDLRAAYQAADVFVLPSRGEGLPTALLEAMSFRRCVVATDVPGNSDVVRNGWNGVLGKAGDPVELAQKIDSLLTDHALRDRLAKQARQDIERNYNPEVVLNKILGLYREVQDNLSLKVQP